MVALRAFLFPPFRLDLDSGQLWREDALVAVRPKPFAVLQYLVEHAGRLVSQQELRKAVWETTYVSEVVLRVYIRDLRTVLGDNPEAPRFIETVPRRGYRWIAPLHAAPPVASNQFPVASQDKTGANSAQLGTGHWELATRLVGRDTELAHLHRCLAKALNGERQIIFVTGEAGIGKTTLVDAFLEQVQSPKSKVQSLQSAIRNPQSAIVGRGQCVEHYGVGEAYLPVLEALGRLGRGAGGEPLIQVLRQYGPTWLAQLPALLNVTEREALQREVLGASRERMLRECAEVVEVLTAQQPLILQLEDLHWSDVSTVDLLAFLARRQEAARLLVVGTYRPVDVILSGHPLHRVKQELQMHGQCTEMALEFLRPAAIEEYLNERFPGHRFPAVLAQVLHRRTDGNALFLVNVVEYLIARGLIGEQTGQWELQAAVEEVERGVPHTLQQMIEKQLERISSEEQEMLAVASVVGVEFSAAAVTVGPETEVGEVEARCARLARQGCFLHAAGVSEWPDGTVAARYDFIHPLYQHVLYERVPAGRRLELHRRIGTRLEKGYGEQTSEIAAELAMHFEHGREYEQAVQYLEQAAQTALQRSAYGEAIAHFTKGLALLKMLPDTPQRLQQELQLQVALGAPLMVTKSWSAPEVEQAYTRARELCRQTGETPQLLPALWGLYRFYLGRGEHRTARELAEQILRLAHDVHDSLSSTTAHSSLGVVLLLLGDLVSAGEHLERGITLYDRQQYRFRASLGGDDAGVAGLSFGAWALWLRGYPDQALKRSQEALVLAQELTHPFIVASALGWATWLHHSRREERAVQERAEAALKLATEQGFAYWGAMGTMMRGWARAAQGAGEEGIAEIGRGLAAHRAIGAEALRPYSLALLAEAQGKNEQPSEGLRVLVEALMTVDKTDERFWEAELYRLKGELTLQQCPQWEEAEACFLKAIGRARRQEAKSLELRAVMSLSRLWQQQGKQTEAHKLLAEIYGWFTEGFDTADLQEARMLLSELDHGSKREGRR